MDNILPKVEVARRADAITTNVEEEITVLLAKYTPEKNWQSQDLEMGIQISKVETITIDDIVLRVKSEGRIPRCFKCDPKGHIKEN